MLNIKKSICIITIPIGLLLFNSNTAFAQLSTKDSIFYTASIHNALKVYHRNIGDQAAKFNGSQYQGYTVSFNDGHPYFKANVLALGSIVYDGVQFDSVNIMYDEVADCVILQDSSHRIKLVNERLSAFTLHESNFEHLLQKTNAPLLNDGFYQLLHKGPVSLYKKETKKMIDKFTNVNELSVIFETHQYYYVLKGDTYFEIKKKKEFISLFSDHEKDISKNINDQHLNFRKAREEMMIKVIEYYNQLTN